jgi:hypothetical protein
MNIFRVLLILIAASYGGLTTLAGIVQLKQRKINLVSSSLMILGGLLLILALMLNLNAGYKFIILVIGLMIIHGSAISNGFHMFGRINPRHHVIRLGVSIFIIALFLSQ